MALHPRTISSSGVTLSNTSITTVRGSNRWCPPEDDLSREVQEGAMSTGQPIESHVQQRIDEDRGRHDLRGRGDPRQVAVRWSRVADEGAGEKLTCWEHRSRTASTCLALGRELAFLFPNGHLAPCGDARE